MKKRLPLLSPVVTNQLICWLFSHAKITAPHSLQTVVYLAARYRDKSRWGQIVGRHNGLLANQVTRMRTRWRKPARTHWAASLANGTEKFGVSLNATLTFSLRFCGSSSRCHDTAAAATAHTLLSDMLMVTDKLKNGLIWQTHKL